MPKLAKYKPLIYAVDDDVDDRYLLANIFSRHFQECTLRQFEEGASLLTHLTHRLDGRLPDLIILDLHMPLFNGFELLRHLKMNDCFRSIPIVVLSACEQQENIEQGYSLGTISYISKVQPYSQLVTDISYLEQYWLTEVTAPAYPTKQSVYLAKELTSTELSIN
jgi:CheY-like chemotaxis protein